MIGSDFGVRRFAGLEDESKLGFELCHCAYASLISRMKKGGRRQSGGLPLHTRGASSMNSTELAKFTVRSSSDDPEAALGDTPLDVEDIAENMVVVKCDSPVLDRATFETTTRTSVTAR